MRWSEHPTTARHELKCQELCATFRSSGYGVYWMIMEAIGEYSNSLHLKVFGISDQVDGCYRELLVKSSGGTLCSGVRDVTHMVPELSHRVLARQCFMKEEELLAIIAKCVEVGLFDEQKWMTYHILYSHELEARAAYYTKRLTRSQDIPSVQLTPPSQEPEASPRSGGNPEVDAALPRGAPAGEAADTGANAPPGDERNQRAIEIFQEKGAVDAPGRMNELSTHCPQSGQGMEVIGGQTAEPPSKALAEGGCGRGVRRGIFSDEEIQTFHGKLQNLVASLNEKHGSDFKLEITDDQLRELRSGFVETSIRNPGEGEGGRRLGLWIYPQEVQIVVAVASLVSEGCRGDDQFQWLRAFLCDSFRSGLFNGGIDHG